MFALALRPVGGAGLAVTIAVGFVAMAPPLPALDATPAHRRWLMPLAVGIGGFVVARLLLTAPAPPVRTWVILANVGAAVAEEAAFRRLLYGWLLRWGSVIAIAVSALVFAAVHVPWYGTEAFWVDLGAGLVLSWQRWASGSWSVPAITHSAANLLQLL